MPALLHLSLCFIVTTMLIFALFPMAVTAQLVDKPNQRKLHSGEVPLIGGIAIWLGMLACLLLFKEVNLTTGYFLLASGILVAVGALDDRYKLNIWLRIVVEVVAASIMIFCANLWVGNLGNLLAVGELHLPFWFAYVFTVIAVFGIINAINMIDGVDGLAASTALGILVIMLLLTRNSPTLTIVGPYMIGALLAFLVFNLSFHQRLPKVFLGDAGSKVIGLTLVWILIETAQSGSAEQRGIDSVTALYIIGLPLMDMVATTIRRLRKSKHPFHPDRSHIHHLLLDAGFSAGKTLFSLLLLSSSINIIGIILQRQGLTEALRFAIIFGLFIVYTICVERLSKQNARRAQLHPDQTKQTEIS